MEKIASIVKGVADGCIQSECCLIGGETAGDWPGFILKTSKDLAGFAVGIVDKSKVIDIEKVSEATSQSKSHRDCPTDIR